jgi:signal transduction histidine kinase
MASVLTPVASALDPSPPDVIRLQAAWAAELAARTRSPLQMIAGFAELLSTQIKGPLNKEQQQYVSYIQRDSRLLLALLNEALELGRIEAGQLER